MDTFRIEKDVIAQMRARVAADLWDTLDPDDVGTLPASVILRESARLDGWQG